MPLMLSMVCANPVVPPGPVEAERRHADHDQLGVHLVQPVPPSPNWSITRGV